MLLFLFFYERSDNIFSCTFFRFTADAFGFDWVKFKSLAEFMGIRCRCACGTSNPTTLMPQRLQRNAFSIA
jgi:hypothetical protein